MRIFIDLIKNFTKMDFIDKNFYQTGLFFMARRRLFGQGKILKAEIARNGYRHGFVAEKVGIPYGTFHAYLNDRQGIPELVLRGILQIFPNFKARLFDFAADQPQQKLLLTTDKLPRKVANV
jgi:hypothetical protein